MRSDRTTPRPAPTAGPASAVPGARCLGCADSILLLPHMCAGQRELVPYGGRCACTEPDCQARQTGARPARSSGRSG